ncbi:MAG TPA: molybdate ABC transporter substrate-binding protein [Candidatus Acidoferrales bacterium]|nr:molybdate ABC transporter substrate-binding protein [Candidatus Acidoferrales bacterium]
MDFCATNKAGKGTSLLLCAICFALAGCGNVGHSPNQPVTLTVSAAISLKGPLQLIGQNYQRTHPDQRVVCNFGASGTLQRQIEQGAPVDVFISAGERQMDALEKEKLLVPGTRRDLLSNQMALIEPARSQKIKTFADLRQRSVKTIAVGNPKIVPAGMYAQEVLEHLRLLPAIQHKLVYAADVRQALAYVETGNADAGLVYVTDAKITSAVRVAAIAPEDSHLPILYPVALLTSSKSPEAARSFLDTLESPDSLAAFEKAGFGAANSQAAGN